MTIIKLKLLANSFILYRTGKKIYRCKSHLDHSQQKLPLTHPTLTKLSNNYQKLLKNWVSTEKRILFLRGFIRMKNNHNF